MAADVIYLDASVLRYAKMKTVLVATNKIYRKGGYEK